MNLPGMGRLWKQSALPSEEPMSDHSGQNGDWQALFSFLGDAQQNSATARAGLHAPNNENVNGPCVDIIAEVVLRCIVGNCCVNSRTSLMFR
ncbi:hypothetical protein AK812_SmicGene6467 [Symbiodinium microadriaticum]|uniref:Uncharacterized protein n=1 Tax=Symbiodinium microadriaticum TaxID=2951 RepID=A0A1Q9ER14_SYMMI|nr:hypothetical protein AK812_SmicGene6467 [Symbiodinium microadriaticum]